MTLSRPSEIANARVRSAPAWPITADAKNGEMLIPSALR
jgi:hypothetical protein